MTVVIIDNKVKDREAYVPLAKAFAEAGSKDKGCIEMKVYVDPEASDRVVFLTKWETKEDFFAQVQSEAFAKYIPLLAPYLVSGENSILELA